MSRLREKTTATLLIAIFMISTLSVMSVEAYTAEDYATAVLNAADRLVDEQNPDGGFRMWIKEIPPGTYLRTHNIGVTAIGILKAHELQDKTEYETALAKSYKFVEDHKPGWIEDPKDATKWKEVPSGVNSWPDIHFLIGLAEDADSDSSLLAAIQSEVPGATVSDIVALAKYRWDDRLVHYGAVYPNVDGTATSMAERLVEVRVPKWASLIPWDLEAAVKSALALHEKYPEDGYLEQAQDIANVIYDCIFVEDPPYLDVNDPEERCYTLGLAGAIEAFTEAGLYPQETHELKSRLILYQNEVGFWDASDLSDQESVQSTAYAVMALLAQGDDDALTSALKGVNWLVDTQDELGGWDPSSLESGDENLEVDGEAAWAIARARFMVRAIGHFTTNYDYLGSGIDHRCFINLHARQVADGWTGKGVFRDKDYKDGKLKAVFVVESASYENLPHQINFVGTTDVYIGKEYIGNYVCEPTIFTTSTWEAFSFQIPELKYYAFVVGKDISVEMTLKVLG